MHPILLAVGPVTLYSYGATMVVAFLLVIWLSGKAARQLPADLLAITAEQLLDFWCVALLAGVAGARLFYLGLYWPVFVRAPWEILALWHGGLVWYGGFLGGLAGAGLYLRAKQLDILRVMDQAVPFVALGHAIGRIGCFLNGCCYGRPSTAWCALAFPGLPERVLPTQLFEAAGLLALFWGLRRLQPEGLRARGRLLGSYLLAYAALRFGVEFLRGDQVAQWGGLTLQQLISLGVGIAGLALLVRAHPPRPTR